MDTKSRAGKVLSVILIFSIIASVFMLGYVIVTPKQGEKFTEFYILGDNRKAEGYPTQMVSGENSSIIVGIVNHEYNTTNYTLELLLKNNTLTKLPIQLMHNSTWEERIFFTPQETGDALELQFLLFKEENFAKPYRDLHLWVNVK